VDERAGHPRRETDSDRARFEAALRRRGLPLVVRRDRRGSAILRRSAPALAFMLLIEPLSSLITALLSLPPDRLEERLSNALWVFGLLALAVAVFVAPAVAGSLVSKWLRVLPRGGRLAVAVVVLVLFAVGSPIVEFATGLRKSLWLGLVVNGGLTVLVLAGVYVGAGSILAWGLRRAFRQLVTVGTMATRALPLLVIVVLFAFFSTEMWQIAEALPRWRLWLVVALFAALSVLFMIAVLREELGTMVDEAIDGRLPELPADLADLSVDGAAVPTRPTAGERANLMLVLFLAQALQIAMLAVLVFCLFIGLGALAVDQSVVDAWLGEGKFLEAGTLFGLQLPLPKALVQLSIFLSVFCGLYFTASAATDPLYRKAFFEPLVEDVRVSLAVRQAYLALRGDEA